MSRPILIGAQTSVPRELIVSEIALKQHLLVPNGSTGEYFQLAEEDQEEDRLLLPRAFDLRDWIQGRPEVFCELLRPEEWWDDVEIGTTAPKLGPNPPYIAYNQGPAWSALTQPLGWPWGRGLALGCGKGKTSLSLRYAQLRRKRTLVVCHTIVMVDTWMAEARNLFGVPQARMGKIGGGVCDWEDKDLVFCTMPGVFKEDLPPDFYERWGLVVYDEGDLLGATKLSNMLPLFLGERLLVTATWERKDGNHRLYELHVGDPCFWDIEPDLQPVCYVMDSIAPKSLQKRTRKGDPHIPLTVNALAEFEPRHSWALSIVDELLADGRKVLFLGERVDELQRFCYEAETLIPGKRHGLALGSQHMKVEEIDKNLKTCDCVWAIQQIAKRGLNERAFDTVVIQYATYNDRGRLQQTIGRALRFHEDKKQPVVVLLNDPDVPIMDKQAWMLAREFEAKGYEVIWYEPD